MSVFDEGKEIYTISYRAIVLKNGFEQPIRIVMKNVKLETIMDQYVHVPHKDIRLYRMLQHGVPLRHILSLGQDFTKVRLAMLKKLHGQILVINNFEKFIRDFRFCPEQLHHKTVVFDIRQNPCLPFHIRNMNFEEMLDTFVKEIRCTGAGNVIEEANLQIKLFLQLKRFVPAPQPVTEEASSS